jgi:hypothetical protein
MSQKITEFVDCFRSLCISPAQVRAYEMASSRRVSRSRGRLLEERVMLNRISIVFTVGEPVVYQQQPDWLA